MTREKILKLCKSELRLYLKDDCYGLVEDMMEICKAIYFSDISYIKTVNFIKSDDNFRKEKMDKIRAYLFTIGLKKEDIINETKI